MNSQKIRTLIIGIGNEFRCDDAVGIITARKLKLKKIPDSEVIENNGDGAFLMDIWSNYERVFVIDAMKMNDRPGVIHVINANVKKLPKGVATHSSHLFSVAEAIETSKVMGKLPQKLMIYGIEGKSFEFGTQISKEASSASDKVVKIIEEEIST